MPPFNKMFVMLPVMLAARKLDGEDPNTVHMVRVAYAAVQTLCVLVVLWTYLQARAVIPNATTIYVPPPAQPFADPNAKKKYTEISYGQHVYSTARSLVGSTLFGIVLTCGLHYYKGMVMGLAIQAVMGPVNLFENALVRTVLLKGAAGLAPESAVFEEKKLEELTADDEIVDEQGNPVVRSSAAASAKATKALASSNSSTGSGKGKQKQTLEEILFDTWDQGVKANLKPLLSAINEQNVNSQTSEDQWTALMIVSGLNCPGAGEAIQQLRTKCKADLTVTDKDGWTALHWAAFHNSEAAAKELCNEAELLLVKDKEGKTPAETAKAEGNDTVAALLQPESKKSQ